MTDSPFLDLPRDAWVASNRSAFAFRDGYPVTDGHTLVVSRRAISTWWEASADERVDLLALVDEVKRQLDESHRPDGFNVGFNAGRAAGQTVDHLHLHVIPRYAGDMADPRGGVRHVIPAKGNYLAAERAGASAASVAPAEIALADGLDHELLPILRSTLADVRFDRADVVVSFVRRSGINLLLPDLRDALDRDVQLRLLTTDYLGITEPAALEQLHDLAADYPHLVSVRVYRAGSRSFHPKSYIFWSSTDPAAARSFVGSSNLTRSALSGGIEWNVGFDAVAVTLAAFEQLWADEASAALDRSVLDEIEQMPRPAPVRTDGTTKPVTPDEPVDDADYEAVPEPHDVQKEALAELALTRQEGQRAGLVVMATGLGKTYLSAFDVVETEANRMLFLAHREEILQQARDTYRSVVPEASMGLFIGPQREPDARFVFASVQSLVRHLDTFTPDAFDYIVVDEFHHAAANSYRRIIDHFEPQFLLGLTATPDRLDGASILSLCNDNLVFSCDLIQGIDRDLLAPFTYHGLSDPTDYSQIPWRNDRFDPEDLEVAVATDERARAVYEGWAARRGERTLAFCVSQVHADYMADWFRHQGVRAAAVHSGSTSAPRHASVRQLEAGELEVIFTVDVFNEGLDVPSIDTVTMLRPTSSPVVFLQQLGRGLRKDDEAASVTVIDMIGNHDAFLLRPRILLSMALGRTPTSREVVAAMRSGEFSLPAGCAVSFDLQVLDLLDELVRRRAATSDLLAEYVRNHLNEEGLRPTKTQALRAGLNPSPSATKHPWFRFLAEQVALDEEERATLDATGDVLPRFERMLQPATKSYKPVTVRALLAAGTLRSGLPIRELADRARQLMIRDPRLLMDVRGRSFPTPETAPLDEWEQLWRKNPVDALTTSTRGEPALFSVEDERLVPTFVVPDEHGDTFDAMVAELADYRLAKYLLDRPTREPETSQRYVLKVSHSSGKPIVRYDRQQAEALPQGEDVPFVADETTYRGDFRTIALNVARRPGEGGNVLPELLRGWFGPSAGHPGTAHRVVAEKRGKYWTLVPEHSNVPWTPLPLLPKSDATNVDPHDVSMPWLEVGLDDADPERDQVTFAHEGDTSGRWERGDLLLMRGSSGVPGEAVRRLLPSEFNRLERHAGTWFRRDAVPELFGHEFNQGNWNTGHVSLEDDTVLFITLKGGEYANEFLSPDRLVWFTQNSTSPESKKGREVLDALTTGRRLHAFCRREKGAFVYVGLVIPLEYEGTRPIRITYGLLTPLSRQEQQDLIHEDP